MFSTSNINTRLNDKFSKINNNLLYLYISCGLWSTFSPSFLHHETFYFSQVRGILNKLTPQTFDKLSDELINIGLDSQVLLKGVILLVSYLSNLT